MTAFVLAFSALPAGPTLADDAPAQSRPPALRSLALAPLPLGAVRPEGWLKGQLKIQAAGLSGHLDEFWPDIKDSAWTGGKAEGWERAPYWLDGIVPLAFLLDDPALKKKAKRFIDYVLDHQQLDGWLGPISDGKHAAYDPWPLYVVFKAFTQYQEATGDPRIVPSLLKCARKIDEVTTRTPLESWAHFRSADLALSLYWLYDRTHEAWLLDLARKIQAQGFDWRKHFENFRLTGKTPSDKIDLASHGVNTGMGLKQPGVRFRLTGDPKDRDAITDMLGLLDRYHGQATGVFTCDEHLAGRSPSQGTELCTVVEAMYSLEVVAAITGQAELGDRLERLAFNALPATFKPDMCAHQYDQQTNQVVCKLAPERVYVSNGPDANLYGLEPNFGCCTANMHQGWPKLVENLWMSTPDGGLAAVAYGPSRVKTQIGGKPVTITLTTDYPFDDTLHFSIVAPERVAFPLKLRIPAWSASADVTVGQTRLGETAVGDFITIAREWSGTTEVRVRLPMRLRLWQGLNDSVALWRGPLVFALRIGESWRKLKGTEPFADWEVYPTTPWNYALEIERSHPEMSVRFDTRHVGDRPFSPEGAPILVHTKGRRVPSWGLEKNAAAPPPTSPVESSEPLEDIVLVPYGCTNLRITEFPTLKSHE